MARLFRKKEEGKKSLWDRIVDVALTDVTVLVKGLDEGSLEGLEETLIAADFGVPATLRLVEVVETLAERGVARSQRDFLRAVREEIVAILRAGRSDTALRFNYEGGPTVFLVVGVNGVGKTTTIAKLAHRLTRQGRKVMIAAGDTFRAGAIEQLRRWAERVGCEFVGSEPGRDPAAVAFDALEQAQANGTDVLIIDTAGRLQTKEHLMRELEKIFKVCQKKLPGAPHETLLVLDATTGQNAISQAEHFKAVTRVTGLFLAKLDGTAKGGIVVAIKDKLDIPVKFVGTGETPDDVARFNADEFVEALFTD
jgi:fused signal recognition particle receptor